MSEMSEERTRAKWQEGGDLSSDCSPPPRSLECQITHCGISSGTGSGGERPRSRMRGKHLKLLERLIFRGTIGREESISESGEVGERAATAQGANDIE